MDEFDNIMNIYDKCYDVGDRVVIKDAPKYLYDEKFTSDGGSRPFGEALKVSRDFLSGQGFFGLKGKIIEVEHNPFGYKVLLDGDSHDMPHSFYPMFVYHVDSKGIDPEVAFVIDDSEEIEDPEEFTGTIKYDGMDLEELKIHLKAQKQNLTSMKKYLIELKNAPKDEIEIEFFLNSHISNIAGQKQEIKRIQDAMSKLTRDPKEG